jgi:hypothetical protein
MIYKATINLEIELINASTLDDAQRRTMDYILLLKRQHQVVDATLVNVFQEKRVKDNTRILTKTRTRSGD